MIHIDSPNPSPHPTPAMQGTSGQQHPVLRVWPTNAETEEGNTIYRTKHPSTPRSYPDSVALPVCPWNDAAFIQWNAKHGYIHIATCLLLFLNPLKLSPEPWKDYGAQVMEGGMLEKNKHKNNNTYILSGVQTCTY